MQVFHQPVKRFRIKIANVRDSSKSAEKRATLDVARDHRGWYKVRAAFAITRDNRGVTKRDDVFNSCIDNASYDFDYTGERSPNPFGREIK
jgi:hypothetical protein